MQMSHFLGKQFGSYRLVKEIARGGFGTVYQAQHTILTDRVVAIKVLHDLLLNSAQERDAFLQEAQFLEKLKHPFILPLLDIGIQQNIPFLITEYAASGSLRSRLQAQSSHVLAFDESLTILSQIGQALQYAHHHNIIHRDLKPDNILFNLRGEALLADFGIATILSTASIRHTSITGTPAYMAPEQFRGQVSRETDQYSLGCIAYELLTGRKPFTAPDFVALGFKHATEQPIPPSQLNPNLSHPMQDALLKAMAKQREDRYPDVATFVAALQGSSHLQRKQASTAQELSVSPFSTTLPISRTRDEASKGLDPETVWKGIQQKNLPITWHLLEAPLDRSFRVPFWAIGWFVGFIFGFLVGAAIPSLWGILVVVSMLIGSLIGYMMSVFLKNRLVLMPDGFIQFSVWGTPRHVISYKVVEDIRFESAQNILTITMTPLSREVAIGVFKETPKTIAQSIQLAYTRFKTRNNLP